MCACIHVCKLYTCIYYMYACMPVRNMYVRMSISLFVNGFAIVSVVVFVVVSTEMAT